MTMKNKLLCAGSALLALTASAAVAQTHRSSSSAAAPAAAGTPLSYGPPIAGLCVYSNSQVLGVSSVGRAFTERMQQLRAQAAAELSGQQTTLQNEEKVLAGKRATLTQEQFAQQAQPLAAREQQLQQTAELRSRDLQYTYQRQVERIGQVIEPLVRTSFEAHHCSALLNGDAIMAVAPAMNLSGEVTTALNARMSTITFDRETAPAQ
jgi:Skp family chaperone for outer membrane proteins